MPYRSGFEFRNGGIGPYLGAIPFAAVAAACIGTAVTIALLSFTQLSWSLPSSLMEVVFALIGATVAIGLTVTAATFIVGFYLALFGLPVALLMGRHLHNRWALSIALLDAAAGALFAITGDRIGALEDDGPSLLMLLVVLSFALPAGFLYRRNIIALREQAAILDSC